ncbi:phospho-sugar mutase, partial [bacterium]|nr:phospho-sugar mutase [bacterium]
TVPDARVRGVAVACDARRNSDAFARDAAAVLAGRGFRVHLAPHPLPTPLLSFATAHLGACAGVIVTASHNPPADNGYKVFGADGAQIVSPFDVAVQDRLAAMPLDVGTLADPDASDLVTPWPDAVLDAYFARIAAVRVHRATGARIVYTPVHGVGRDPVLRALGAAGHTDIHVVPSQ